MTRTLTSTPAEWEVLQRDGAAWIVRDGDCPHKVLPCGGGDCCCPHFTPAELVAAAAPCKRCDGARNLWWPGSDRSAPCPACRITLVAECPACLSEPTIGCPTWHPGVVTLGYAYADSDVLPIRLLVDCEDDGEHICIDGDAVHIDGKDDPLADLGHCGAPDALVGRYALKVRLA